ncbi:hypothetical protein QYM36_003940 [Artemia franciscana]|uniref:Uncharacterized protein n=1 Tax=Artemia franciscana TaxID=6661 RepID=A0AA88L987_ARTSF|nr:hypothetical protein QYM36_003940 [Artemia franciscana]
MKDNAEQKKSTTDFYKAVHAASPIALLAMIAPEDLGHFAVFSPICGLRGAITVHASVKLRFDQRDSSGYPLVWELATIALNYYKGRTIVNSPSLRTADASLENAGIASLWRSIALMRKAAPRDVIMTYYGAMKGEDVAQSLGRIVEADDAAFDNEKTQLENRINNALNSFALPKFTISLASLSRQALTDAKDSYEKNQG